MRRGIGRGQVKDKPHEKRDRERFCNVKRNTYPGLYLSR